MSGVDLIKITGSLLAPRVRGAASIPVTTQQRGYPSREWRRLTYGGVQRGETRGNRRVEPAVANEADLVIVLLDIARSAEPCSTRHYWFYIVKHFSLIARASLTVACPMTLNATFRATIYILVRVPIYPPRVFSSFSSYSIRDSVDILMDPTRLTLGF